MYNLDPPSPPLINFTYHNNWWLDSGANVHVWFDHAFFKSYHNSSGASVTLENDCHTCTKNRISQVEDDI